MRADFDRLRSIHWAAIAAAVMMVLIMGWRHTVAAAPAQAEQTIDPATIRDAVERYIVRNAPWGPDQMKIKEIRFQQPLQAPSGRVTLRVASPKHNDWLGATPFSVHIAVEGRHVRRITVPAHIEVWSDVIMTAKPLGKYQPIEKDDLHVKRMNLDRAPSNVVVRLDQALGRRVTRNIAADCILRMDQIESPPLVRRGDIVQIIAQTPVLKISVKGMAKQDGAKGERIKVINLRSKKRIYAQVVDDQTVLVDF